VVSGAKTWPQPGRGWPLRRGPAGRSTCSLGVNRYLEVAQGGDVVLPGLAGEVVPLLVVSCVGMSITRAAEQGKQAVCARDYLRVSLDRVQMASRRH
jgi:hypothetical protein